MLTATYWNKKSIIVGRYFSLARAVVVLAVLIGIAYPSQAGLIVITTDPGTKPEIGWDTNGDKKMDKFDAKKDTDRDGKIEIVLGSPEDEKKINSIWVLKYGDGKQIFYEIKLDDTGITLASLEPFHFPTFTAPISLIASIDITAFLATGDMLDFNQGFTVNDGVLAESSTITFKDGSSLVGSPQFSRDLVASLPNYTGPVNFYSLDKVLPAPEPASFWLVSVALLCLFVTRKKFNSKYNIE